MTPTLALLYTWIGIDHPYELGFTLWTLAGIVAVIALICLLVIRLRSHTSRT